MTLFAGDNPTIEAPAGRKAPIGSPGRGKKNDMKEPYGKGKGTCALDQESIVMTRGKKWKS